MAAKQNQSGSTHLYTEELNSGQTIVGVKIVNPLEDRSWRQRRIHVATLDARAARLFDAAPRTLVQRHANGLTVTRRTLEQRRERLVE